MAYKTKSDTLQLRYNLKKIIPQRNEAIFTIRKNDDNEAIGELRLFHRKIVDQSKKMGTQGYIKNPNQGHFPERIVIKGIKSTA